jgi:hypothetical protein
LGGDAAPHPFLSLFPVLPVFPVVKTSGLLLLSAIVKEQICSGWGKAQLADHPDHLTAMERGVIDDVLQLLAQRQAGCAAVHAFERDHAG